jgi:indolepyruvate ferredoxin oxidoreductase alpha subunit
MLEPADSQECLDYTKLAFELSEEYDTPVIVRSNTRISHSTGVCEVSARVDAPLKDYIKSPEKYVMMPLYARPRHKIVEERLAKLKEYAETTELNKIEDNGGKTGIITAGISYQYAKETFGDSVSYLKLGLAYPMPEKKIKDFAAKYERVIVIEELDEIIEGHCKKLGLKVEGKGPGSRNPLTNLGEFSQEYLRETLLGVKPEFTEIGAGAGTTEKAAMAGITTAKGMTAAAEVPQRPPVMCPGCSHRGIFYVIKKLDLFAGGDIGCYTLGAAPPLNALDTCICMGGGVSLVHGFNKVRPDSHKKSIGVIGDSTFMHSGVTGLLDIVYNKGMSKILVVDNITTGMTGHQDHPGTGRTLKGEKVPMIMIENIAKACGIKDENLRIFDPCDIKEAERILKEELAKDEPSVLIARRPCALLKYVDKSAKREIKDCKKCKVCMKIGCPAIAWSDGKGAEINPALCNGCGLCENLCKPGCIGVK